MAAKPWAKSEDGTIEYQLLTFKYLDDAQNLMKTYYVKEENVCRAVRFAENPEAIERFMGRLKTMAKQGISVIAINTTQDKVVGVCFNQIFVKSESKIEKKYTEPEVAAVAQFSEFIENRCNIFEKYNIDCYVELMSVSTSPDYRGKGIAKTLFSVSVDVCRCLKKGEIKTSPFNDDAGKPMNTPEPVPQAVVSVFSSFITQNIGKQLGFEIIASLNYDEFCGPSGETFASVIGESTKSATFEYLEL